MFDISWGEIAVLGAVGITVTGKRDLPRASRFIGLQLGRVVGLLQGARARADRFTHHNELRALQNELRSGLRELDQVKTELAISASTQGVMGRGLGATTPSANRRQPGFGGGGRNSGSSNHSSRKSSQSFSAPLQQQAMAPPPSFPPSAPVIPISHNTIRNNTKKKNNAGDTEMNLNLSDFDFHVADSVEEDTNVPKDSSTKAAVSLISQVDSEDHQQQQQHSMHDHEQEISPVAQSERAVMEEEWTKQGIGFKAQAEKGSWIGSDSDNSSNHGDNSSFDVIDTTRATGSELLEHLERQCLIFDQYDRVVGEQEKEMEERVERIQNQRRNNNDPPNHQGRDQQGNKDGKQR